ncbi:Dihydroorotate dehydrogenase (NAD(+)), electron transfer subunit [hydrothermal vent metagenome]|uniref:Dihydroorotate dehydrogenase (NAD(+)), electron transfer subunit n=1 Tax=hydrothermal vent metagenome TaxID=652676 RepID=A0A3B0QVE0_9ZZZZ
MKEAIIIENKPLGADFFLISLKWGAARKVRPGQFVMLRVTGSMDPLLRRPFSVYNVEGDTIELLYKVVGKGTTILSSLNPGDGVDLLGPLGKGFPIPGGMLGNGRLLMVAGGVGIAPFYHLGRSINPIRGLNCDNLLIYGARTKRDTVVVKSFKNIGVKSKVATEDGTRGTKGLVTDLLEREMHCGDIVYACGPSPMLKAVAKLAEAKGIRCLVSLERAMACGIGVCLGCAIKTVPHRPGRVIKDDRSYHMVCSDGPVFDSRDVDWDRL